MRVSNHTRATFCTHESSSKAGSSVETFTGDHQFSYEGRDDIRKNAADATGWRKPSPYAASFRRSQPWTGSATWLDDYDAVGGGTDFQRRSFNGNLSLLPSSLATYKPNPLLIPPVTEPPVYQRAVNRALANLKDQQVQYATFLAEAGKSSNMIISNLKLVSNSLRNIKRGRFSDAANDLRISSKVFKSRKRPKTDKEISARWLEARYGWLPLLSDTYSIYEEARKGFFREPRISCKGKGVDSKTYDQDISHNLFIGEQTTNVVHSCFVRMDFVLSSARLQKASNAGLTNPLEVAWELVPYSFLIDWLAPISEFLSSLDADFGVTFKAGSYTTYYRTIARGYLDPTNYKSTGVHRYSAGGSLVSSYFALDINRRVFSAAPIGSFYIKNPLSLLHVANALALIHQRLR